MKARIIRLIIATTLGLTVLTACGGGEGSETNCGLDQCTVTFDRGVEANASVLGVEAKLINAEDDRVTVEVAGEQLTLTTGQAATDVGGLKVTLQSVTDTHVVIKIAK